MCYVNAVCAHLPDKTNPSAADLRLKDAESKDARPAATMERVMGIEPTPTAWKAVVLAVILHPRVSAIKYYHIRPVLSRIFCADPCFFQKESAQAARERGKGSLQIRIGPSQMPARSRFYRFFAARSQDRNGGLRRNGGTVKPDIVTV